MEAAKRKLEAHRDGRCADDQDIDAGTMTLATPVALAAHIVDFTHFLQEHRWSP
jgi:hypothetical protein